MGPEINSFFIPWPFQWPLWGLYPQIQTHRTIKKPCLPVVTPRRCDIVTLAGRNYRAGRCFLGKNNWWKKWLVRSLYGFARKWLQKNCNFKEDMRINHAFFPVPYFETQPHFWGYFIVSTIEVSQSSCNEKFWPHKLGCFIPKMRKVFVLRNRSMNRGFTDFLVRASSFPALMFNGKKTHIKRKIENGKLSSLFFILYDSCTFCFIILIHE